VLGTALVLTLLAILGKFIGGNLGTFGFPLQSRIIVGIGMVPRGEVGLVAASIAVGKGAISADMFSVVVFMSLATTILVPILLSRVYHRSGTPVKRRDAVAGL
jgi:Kef-type K+ transport system membrane component KefB